jgi:hypothetical protein
LATRLQNYNTLRIKEGLLIELVEAFLAEVLIGEIECTVFAPTTLLKEVALYEISDILTHVPSVGAIRVNLQGGAVYRL